MIKTAGHKGTTQKSGTFLCTKTVYAEAEIKNTAQFIIAAKKLKHLGRHLTKQRQDLYGKNYKMLWQTSKRQVNGETYHVREWKDNSNGKDENTPQIDLHT